MFMSAIKPSGRNAGVPLPCDAGEELGIYAYVGNDPVNFTDPLGLQQTPPRPEPPKWDDEIVVTGTRCGGIRVSGIGGQSICVSAISFDLPSPFERLNFGDALGAWISNGVEIVQETADRVRCAGSSYFRMSLWEWM